MSQPMTHHRQVRLPGQSCVADGPHDHTGMYVMHFAFRRDLDALVAAVRATPLGHAATWAALRARWVFFADVLHHHHRAEDEHYWPVVERAARRRGTPADTEVLAAMSAEHDDVDPGLAAAGAAFVALLDHPCAEHRNALDIRLTALRELLGAHLDHEEREALPLVQRLLTAQEFAEVDAAVGRAYPVRMVPRLVPWVSHRLPEDVTDVVLSSRTIRLVRALTRRRFERAERRAFRYAGQGPSRVSSPSSQVR